jgi:branched-chain amino acid transport system substrate-binding protein
MRRPRSLSFLSFVAAAVLLVSTGAPGADVQGLTPTSILIGVQVSLTGPASSIGTGFKAGTELALSEINAHGGINGRKLEAVYEDDAGTAEGGISAVRRLMDQDKVFMIFGGGTSTSTASVIPLIQQSNFLYYDSLASDPRVLETYSPDVFSGGTVVRADVATYAVKVMQNLFKAKTVGFISNDEAFCSSAVRLLEPKVTAAGMKLVVQEKFKSGDTDYTAQAASIKAANPDALYACGLPVDGGRMIPQLRRGGVTSKIIGDTVLADSVVPQMAGASMEGSYVLWLQSSQYIDEQRNPMLDWRARFAKHFPNAPTGTPNSFSLSAYSDMYVVAEGLRRAGKDPTQQSVIAGLEGIQDFVAGKDKVFSYASPIGNPRTFAKGDHKGNRECVLLVVKNGQYQRVENFGS